jgi:PAS domain S-box-containing protein
MSESRSEANAWLTHLLGSASEHAVIFLDTTGRIVAWLGAAERIFGYAKAEALGLGLADLFTPDDRRLQMDSQELAVARAVGRSEDERWHVRKDGTLFWASGVVAAVKTPQGEIEAFCKILRDRTDLRQQLDTLQNRLRALQRENERKSQVLESLGHQLRLLVGPLEDASDEIAAKQRESLHIASRTRRLATVATLLEDAAKSATPHISAHQPKVRSITLQDELRACVESVRPTAQAGGHNLHLTLSPVALTIRADPDSLSEMLRALMANALKQTPSGGNIHITAAVEGASAVVRVVDDGVRIPGKRLSRILLLVTRADRSTNVQASEAELATVKELAAAHGGSLEVRSPAMGKGSAICLRLPIADA